MRERTSTETVESSAVCYDTLEQWAREHIQIQLQTLLEEEVTMFLGRVRHERRSTVAPVDPPVGSRNGYGKPRHFSMMNGTVTVRRPRVRDLAERFESKILPLFKRRTTEVGMLLPELYLHGLSTGDFDVALRGLLGEGAPLSASSIQRLKARFELEYETWTKQDLSDLEVVYWWADGLYVKAGITDRKSALLTIVGALATGEKIVVACESGERESKDSWLTDTWASGPRSGRFNPPGTSNGAGTTSSPTSSILCPRRPRPLRSNASRQCPMPTCKRSVSGSATPSSASTAKPIRRP